MEAQGRPGKSISESHASPTAIHEQHYVTGKKGGKRKENLNLHKGYSRINMGLHNFVCRLCMMYGAAILKRSFFTNS